MNGSNKMTFSTLFNTICLGSVMLMRRQPCSQMIWQVGPYFQKAYPNFSRPSSEGLLPEGIPKPSEGMP